LKKLTVVIPNYKMTRYLEISLFYLARAVDPFDNLVDILVYDDLSDVQELQIIIDKIKELYPNVSIKYVHNEFKTGIARSFINSVKLVNSEFCWIIGADDFVFKESIEIILRIIELYNIDLLVVDKIHTNFLLTDFNNIDEIKIQIDKIVMSKFPLLSTFDNFEDNIKIMSGLSSIIDKRMGNVFLGAIMVNIFRVKLWKDYDIENTNYDGFDTLDSTYPQISIFASMFHDALIVYFNKPLILVGDGARDWTANGDFSIIDERNDYIIHINIINDILLMYKKYGLSNLKYFFNLSGVAFNAGYYVSYFILSRVFNSKKYQYPQRLSLFKSFKINFIHPMFYYGLFRGIVKFIIVKTISLIKNVR